MSKILAIVLIAERILIVSDLKSGHPRNHLNTTSGHKTDA